MLHDQLLKTILLLNLTLMSCTEAKETPESVPESEPNEQAQSPLPDETRLTEQDEKESETFSQDNGKPTSVALEAPNPVQHNDVNLLDKNYLNNKQTMLVDAYKLNVRSGPGDQYPVRRSLRKGERVIVKGKNGVWVQISSHEWVSEIYLKPTK